MLEQDSADMQTSRRRRLFNKADYYPWVRAESGLTDVFLFWAPVSGFPMRYQEKVWLSEFLDRLSTQLKLNHALRSEIFYQFKGVTEIADDFRRYAMQCQMLMGVGRYADEELAGIPPPEVVAEYLEKRKMFDYREWMADYLYWFVSKQPQEQRRRFLGYGSMVTLFMPPDKKRPRVELTLTPAMRDVFSVYKSFDVDSMLEGAHAMSDSFRAKSKKLFGEGLEHMPEYRGITFVLPLLQSAHFFTAPMELREKWFDLFDVYVNESKKDNGVLLAFKKEEYEPLLVDVLQSMRDDGLSPDEARGARLG